MVFNPVWRGPGWPNACNDRALPILDYAPGANAAPLTPGAVPCSEFVPGTVNIPVPLPPRRVAAHYRQRVCQQAVSVHHAPGHMVCGQCVDAAEDKHWYKLAVARMNKAPPAPKKKQTNGTATGPDCARNVSYESGLRSTCGREPPTWPYHPIHQTAR